MTQRGLAEALPAVLRAFRRRLERWSWLQQGSTPEALAVLDRYAEEGAEVPAPAELATVLGPFQLGFGGLEAIQRSLETGEHHFYGLARIPATLLVERLDLGLVGLRLERGLSVDEVAFAAGLKRRELSAFERTDRREIPSLPVLDRLLRALGASYGELEQATADPFDTARKLHRRLRAAERRAEPVVAGGRALPAVVAERLDAALLSLRLQTGWSRRALAEASGVPVGRLAGFEDRARTERPSPTELAALLDALGTPPELLEQAARWPLRSLRSLTSARKPWAHARPQKPRSPDGSAAYRSPLLATARRVEEAISELRTEWEVAGSE